MNVAQKLRKQIHICYSAVFIVIDSYSYRLNARHLKAKRASGIRGYLRLPPYSTRPIRAILQ